MGWKSVLAQYSNPYEETVSVTMHDVETGVEQTIVSNRIHPYFVQVPQKQSLLHLASAETNSLPLSSEGHQYQGVIADGHWVDAANLKAGYRLLNDDESWAEVSSVTIEHKLLKAYNLTVSDFHTYFVASNADAATVWVHNDCWENLPSGSNPTGSTNKFGQETYNGPNGEDLYKGHDGRFYDAAKHPPVSKEDWVKKTKDNDLANGDLGAKNKLLTQLTLNREAGIKFEQQLVDALGHVGGTKNTTPFTVPQGNGKTVTTIPDLLGAECRRHS